jgi:transcription antitermination protein NusB
MAIPQQKFREIVFQLIYSADFADSLDEDMIPLMMEQLTVTKKVMREAVLRKAQVQAKREELDRYITEASHRYDFERITRTERNILRLALFELLYDDSLPPKVVLAESIRLARKFASPEGGAFVNAIVDELYKNKVLV